MRANEKYDMCSYEDDCMDCNVNFHPRKFIHNNIEFRIRTSEAISTYKLNQAFVLNQAAYNKHFKFSSLSKDILLLKFDVWYDWLNEVEQILLKSKNDIKIKEILKAAQDRKEYYEKTLRNNFEGADLEFINFWIEIHDKVYELMIKKILNLQMNVSKGDLFFNITKILSNVMKRTLYELQELETIISDRGAVNICVDNICIEIFKKDFNFFKEKILKYQNIKKFNSVVIKNYSDSDNLEISCEKALEYLKENNIEYIII